MRDSAKRFRVEGKVRLRDIDPSWRGDGDYRRLEKDDLKDRAKAFVKDRLAELSEAQELLYASDTAALLVVLQAMDAAGKDGMIEHVMSGVNPSGCQVFSFKQPSAEELDHDFLWRYARALPERGRIGIFNRSYYEEVLVVRVHPEILATQKLPGRGGGRKFWERRYESIKDFERHLARNGTAIVKFFLHVSREEQKRRLLARLDDPRKHWKFSTADVRERGYWDAYQEAYEEALSATSTRQAPWYVIPSDHKWIARALVAQILVDTIRGLDLRYPKVGPERLKALEDARRRLENE